MVWAGRLRWVARVGSRLRCVEHVAVSGLVGVCMWRSVVCAGGPWRLRRLKELCRASDPCRA